MKKFLSAFLSGLLILSSGPKIFAGGLDKEETLSDGTKLIYISSEKLPQVTEEYRRKAVDLIDKRFTTKKNLAIRGVAVAVGSLGYYISSRFKESYPTAAAIGAIASVVSGTALFFLPDAIDYERGEQCGSLYFDRKGEWRFWGRSDSYGVVSTYYDLHLWCYLDEKVVFRPSKEERDSGVVIVLRPRRKNRMSNITHSGVWSQKWANRIDGLKLKISRGK